MVRNYGWVVVAAGAVITCVAMGALFALPVYLQPIAESTGWSRAGISASMTIAFIVMGFAGFGWGYLSDKIGARPVILVATALLVGGLILASQAPNLIVFQIAYGALVGASGGAFFAPLMSAAVGWFDKNRSLAVSLVSVGGGVAPMVITPLASVLTSTYGWRVAMLSIALGAALALLAAPAAASAPPCRPTTSAPAPQRRNRPPPGRRSGHRSSSSSPSRSFSAAAPIPGRSSTP